MRYKLTETEGFIKLIEEGEPGVIFSDKGEIGKEMWSAYQAWLEKGNEPEPEFTQEKIKSLENKQKENAKEVSNQEARKFLANNDYKCKKYRDQVDMVKFGIRESTDITEDEYKELLIECQEKRDSIT